MPVDSTFILYHLPELKTELFLKSDWLLIFIARSINPERTINRMFIFILLSALFLNKTINLTFVSV